MVYALLLLGWCIFGLIHSLTASMWFKQKVALHIGSLNAYYRLLYNALSITTLLPLLWLHSVAPNDYIYTWHGSNLIGSILLGLGVIIGIFALGGYDLAEFVGWPQKNNVSSEQALRQDGLLRYVRHPLYTGIIVSLIGILIVKPTYSSLILMLAATLYLRIGIYFEEKKLVNTFGKTYEQYRQRVPMLFPYI